MGADSGSVTLLNGRIGLTNILGPGTSWGILRAMSPSEAGAFGFWFPRHAPVVGSLTKIQQM